MRGTFSLTRIIFIVLIMACVFIPFSHIQAAEAVPVRIETIYNRENTVAFFSIAGAEVQPEATENIRVGKADPRVDKLLLSINCLNNGPAIGKISVTTYANTTFDGDILAYGEQMLKAQPEEKLKLDYTYKLLPTAGSALIQLNLINKAGTTAESKHNYIYKIVLKEQAQKSLENK